MIERPFGFLAVLANDGKVVKGEAASAVGRNLVIYTERFNRHWAAAIMAMMIAKVVENIMTQVHQPVIQDLADQQGPPFMAVIRLLGSVHESRMFGAAQHNDASSFRW
jgi:hypothetical protein